MSATVSGRRARLHAATREEVKAIALRQLAAGGIAALSLNAIGREMGLTGPALYRYFASRDALLTDLIVDAYGDLAATVEAVAQAGDGADAAACRARLRGGVPGLGARPTVPLPPPLRHPRAGLRRATGDRRPRAPDHGPAPRRARRSPPPAARARLAAGRAGRAVRGVVGRSSDQPVTGAILRRGVIWWTRLHGVLGLELAGHFTGMGFDPALLFEAEVEALLDCGGDKRSLSDAARYAHIGAGMAGLDTTILGLTAS